MNEEWYEIEMQYSFQANTDIWIKTYRFNGGADSKFATVDEARAHLDSVMVSTYPEIRTSIYRFVRYTREVLND